MFQLDTVIFVVCLLQVCIEASCVLFSTYCYQSSFEKSVPKTKNMTTNSSYSLPSDIELYERKLFDSRTEIEKLRKLSDSVLGPIGLDAVIGVVPIAGDLYTVLAGSWLFILARRVNAPIGDLFLLVVLSGIDLTIGLFPVGGDILDAFFRIHAWFGGRLITHVDMHLSLIEGARLQVGQNQDFDLIALRSSLFKKS